MMLNDRGLASNQSACVGGRADPSSNGALAATSSDCCGRITNLRYRLGSRLIKGELGELYQAPLHPSARMLPEARSQLAERQPLCAAAAALRGPNPGASLPQQHRAGLRVQLRSSMMRLRSWAKSPCLRPRRRRASIPSTRSPSCCFSPLGSRWRRSLPSGRSHLRARPLRRRSPPGVAGAHHHRPWPAGCRRFVSALHPPCLQAQRHRDGRHALQIITAAPSGDFID